MDNALNERLLSLKGRTTDEFSLSCLEGAHRALLDRHNPLRLSFFATAMRTFFEHTMETLAPVEEVSRCAWFEPERDNNKPTRGQKITYFIQGGLQQSFVAETLHVDPAPLRKRLLDAVDECGKQIHSRHYNAITDHGKQDEVVEKILSAFAELFDALHFCRKAVLEPIAEALDEVALDSLLYETLDAVDELASHYYLQEVYVSHTEVYAIGPETITYRARGKIAVILQFGSNSDIRNDMGAELKQSFPFTCDIEVALAEPWNLELAETRYAVDVSEWRDAMGPDDHSC